MLLPKECINAEPLKLITPVVDAVVAGRLIVVVVSSPCTVLIPAPSVWFVRLIIPAWLALADSAVAAADVGAA